jgi:iron-sulfur cluster repair protein YtfE (RIC family)
MQATTARKLLLGQHHRIRTSLVECVGIAKRLRGGEPAEAELEEALEQMRSELYQHNLSETELLRPLLMRTREWGERLLEHMVDEHVAEHVAMWNVMNRSAIQIAHEIDDLAEALDAHMTAEERTFLAVLRVDEIDHHHS